MKHLLKNKRRWSIITLAVGLLLALVHSLLALQYNDFQRISIAHDGTDTNGVSLDPMVSADGNVVVFLSLATNMVPGTPEDYEVFVYNRQSQTLRALQMIWSSFAPMILSADGRYLPTSDYGTQLYDSETETFQPISLNIDGELVHDARHFGMSGDARYIAFHSNANDLLEDMTNCNSLFIRDRQTATTTCIPLAPGQTAADKVSSFTQAIMSRDGSKIYFHNNDNGCCWGGDLYMYDAQSAALTLMDVDFLDESSTYGYHLWKMSTDGTILTFMPYGSLGNNGGTPVQHRFAIYDTNTNTGKIWNASDYGLTTGLPEGDVTYMAYPMAVSGDGRYIAGTVERIDEDDDDWTLPQYRNFIYDRQTNTITRILDTEVDEGAWGNTTVLYSADSTFTTLAFYSDVDDFVSGDNNGFFDVFLASAEPGSFPTPEPTPETPEPTPETPEPTPEDTPTPTPSELLVNGNMDDNDDSVSKLPDGWAKVGSLNKDTVRTNLESVTYAHSAPNTFQFTGTQAEVGVASKLTQKVNLAGKTIKKGDTLTFSAMVDQRSGIPGTPIARAVVTYNNGTKQVYTLKLAKPKITGYAPISISKPLTRGGVQSITVELFYAKANGKFYIDDVSLTHTLASDETLIRLP